MDSISDRLKTLGVHLGQKSGASRAGDDLDPLNKPPVQVEKTEIGWSIEKVVPGIEKTTILGPVYFTEREFGMDYTHGAIHLHAIPALNRLAEWGHTPKLPTLSPQQIVFLDTETSGLAGGTGTYAFMIGLGFFGPASYRVVQLFMRDPAEEPALLTALAEFLTPFEAVVTFNGKSFDIPLLKTRFLLNGCTEQFSTLEHLDLLHLARRLWRNRLESRALGDLEKEIIGFFRQQDEVPGYLIPQYYFDYLRTGDARPLEGVFYHNAFDIVSLAALFEHMAGILESPQAIDLPSLDVIAIARLYEEAGRLEDAAALFESGLNQGLPHEFYINTLERFAMLRRKQGKMDLAVALWGKAAEQNHLPAYEELAKYYEHAIKDLTSALEWSQLGLSKVHQLRMPKYQVQIWEEQFNKRIGRLLLKISRATKN